MERPLPVLDWQRLNHRPVVWGLPTVSFMARDCVWLLVVAGLAAGWGADRWWIGKHHDTVSSTLAEARTVAERARSEKILASEQLRSLRESLAALAAQHQEDDATMAKLRGQIATLQADLRSGRGAQYASGRER